MLKIFKGGKYNANHLLIAHLIKVKAAKTIVITNFDEVIEQACIDLGLKESIDYNVFRTEQEFQSIY